MINRNRILSQRTDAVLILLIKTTRRIFDQHGWDFVSDRLEDQINCILRWQSLGVDALAHLGLNVGERDRCAEPEGFLATRDSD